MGFLQAESSLGVERSHEQVHSFGTCDTFDAIDVAYVTFIFDDLISSEPGKN